MLTNLYHNRLVSMWSDPRDLLDDFERDIEWSLRESGAAAPLVTETPLSVRQTHQEIEVSVDVPGFAAEEVVVLLDGRCLRIEGQTTTPAGRRRSVRRIVMLDRPVDRERIDATLSNGVLAVRMPLLPSRQPNHSVRQIPIRVRERSRLRKWLSSLQGCCRSFLHATIEWPRRCWSLISGAEKSPGVCAQRSRDSS